MPRHTPMSKRLLSSVDSAQPAESNTPPCDIALPFQAAGRWRTPAAYAMRRIVPLKGLNGETIGYRPMIQQGRGANRQTYSEVFRITTEVDASMAMAMAQRWRDRKEAELGISSGQISSKSASRFVPGISLVVTSKAPYRACWRWSSNGKSRIAKYMSKKVGYETAYRALVARICEVIGCAVPTVLNLPLPNPIQYACLMSMGVAELPDRRKAHREWTAS